MNTNGNPRIYLLTSETLGSAGISVEALRRTRLLRGSRPELEVLAISTSPLEELRNECYKPELEPSSSWLKMHTYPFHVFNPGNSSGTP